MVEKNSIWRKTLLPLDTTIKSCIDSLNYSGKKIVMITDKDNFLFGIVTDGDIRRGLINGFNLESSIENLINKNPLVVSSKLSRNKILQIMNSNKIQQIPLVNDKHMWEELESIETQSTVMVIMAGGKGKRLYPLTQNLPKPMLKINDKPILEHIINGAKENGFRNFIISLNYLGDIIQKYFEDGNRLGVKIEYIIEETPLGTAGALSLLKNKLTNSFIVTNGDIITNVNYNKLLDFHIENNSYATMSVRTQFWKNPFGVVKTKGIEITHFEEKPMIQNYINAGIYVLEPTILDLLEKSTYCDMPTLFMRARGNFKKIIAFPIYENWTDIGQPSDLEAESFRQNLEFGSKNVKG
jgi:dTDP-glucose pyrophosphorylase